MLYRPAVAPKPVPPSLNSPAFTCPTCEGFTTHEWYAARRSQGGTMVSLANVSTCGICDKLTVWVDGAMVYPDGNLAPEPNGDMPPEVRRLYDEAASIAGRSPRAAAALLRLAADALASDLAPAASTLDAKIGEIHRSGLLPDHVVGALDVVRVTGNNAVHPGEIDADDPSVVAALFGLLNQIVEYAVSLPAQTNALVESLPPGARAAIDKRNERVARENGGHGGHGP